MSALFRLKMAKQRAEQILAEENVHDLGVDLFALAAKHEIIIQGKSDTSEGVSGMLLRHGDSFGILYATYVKNEGFQRFSIAHELGHYFLDGHCDHIFKSGDRHESRAGFVSNDPFEKEADNFAAGLLMPSGPFKKAIDRHQMGLDAIIALHDKCKTSLTSTAIRYAELADEAVAVIISTGQVVDYCIMSEAMKSLPKLGWIKKGTPVPQGTLTFGFGGDLRRVMNGSRDEGEIDIRDWLGGTQASQIAEQVQGLGDYGKTLTVLSSQSVGQSIGEDDTAEEADLIESWTPRFRR